MTHAQVAIRRLAPQDAPEWRALWTAYLEFYQTSVPEAVFAATFARLVADDPQDFNGLIATVDGKAMGIAHYLFHRSCWTIENVCYLQDLYVDPAARGMGLGRALIEAVYERADAAGAPAVYWLTQETNHQARRLYDRVARVTPFVEYNRAP